MWGAAGARAKLGPFTTDLTPLWCSCCLCSAELFFPKQKIGPAHTHRPQQARVPVSPVIHSSHPLTPWVVASACCRVALSLAASRSLSCNQGVHAHVSKAGSHRPPAKQCAPRQCVPSSTKGLDCYLYSPAFQQLPGLQGWVQLHHKHALCIPAVHPWQ